MRSRRRGGRRPAAPGPRLRARRGALVLILGVLFSSTVVLGALTFDFARLANFKAELQNSADAAAHAGITRFIHLTGCLGGVGVDVATLAAANAHAALNPVMSGAVTAASTLGHWDPGSGGFTPYGACDAAVNAVQVEVSIQSTGLFMAVLGVSPPVVRAVAVGYACPIGGGGSDCTVGASGLNPRPILVR